jgi:hypothetical protein
MDYAKLKQLAETLNRPVQTLIALARNNDPFLILPGREVNAKWAADLWHSSGIKIGFHKRRIHYRLVSLDPPPTMPNGQPYENTTNCFSMLTQALRDAVYLGLIGPNAFTDNRNPDPIIGDVEARDADVYVAGEWIDVSLRMPSLPRLRLSSPTVPQKYAIEIWAEKTTVDDILEPLCHSYHLNAIRGSGEISATQCTDLVDRAVKHGRPIRILYLSDFDPAGQCMPVSGARKIEFEIYNRAPSLDIQVRQVVLTHDQCSDLKLPRTPIKDTELRADAFEKRFGEGATELDALEALHPGLLRRMLVKEIQRYRNEDHDSEVEQIADDIEDQLDEATEEVIELHREKYNEIKAEFEKISRAFCAWCETAKPVWHMMSRKVCTTISHPSPMSIGCRISRPTKTQTLCSIALADTWSRSRGTNRIREN